MKRLTVEQFFALHSQLITASGGMDDVRDKGLVESSLSNILILILVSINIQLLKKRPLVFVVL